jgi:hypothetical protein
MRRGDGLMASVMRHQDVVQQHAAGKAGDQADEALPTTERPSTRDNADENGDRHEP